MIFNQQINANRKQTGVKANRKQTREKANRKQAAIIANCKQVTCKRTCLPLFAYQFLWNSMVLEIHKSNSTKRLIHLISKIFNICIIFAQGILVFQTHCAKVHNWDTIVSHLEQNVHGAKGRAKVDRATVRSSPKERVPRPHS